jgi:hypothetical protein
MTEPRSAGKERELEIVGSLSLAALGSTELIDFCPWYIKGLGR